MSFWDDISKLKHLLCLIYIIPTLILYFLILYIMFWSPVRGKFQGSFYKLFGFSAVNYMIETVAYYALLRFPFIEPFFPFLKNCPKNSWIYPVIYMVDYYAITALHIYNLVLNFNRFTVFVLLAKYKSFWDKYLKYILILCLLLPLLAIWHFPFMNVQCFFFYPYGAAILLTNEKAIPWMNMAVNLFGTTLVTSLLSLGMNIFVIFKLSQRKTHTHQHVSSQDIKMFIYCVLVFIVEFAGCIQQLLLIFWYSTVVTTIVQIQFIVIDISCLAPAWFIVITNKDLRYELRRLFHKSNTPIKITSIQTASSGNF